MDRAKNGSKHHVLTDLTGTPLVAKVTKANEDDRKQLLPMLDAAPAVAGKAGRPKRKPRYLLADRGYDSRACRDALRGRGIEPVVARLNTGHGSGLGKFRWPVERAISWLHQFRRLRARWERRTDMHDAWLQLAMGVICFRKLNRGLS